MARLLLILPLLFRFIPTNAESRPVDKIYKLPAMAECEADEDCTAAMMGCWRWVPINKRFVDMESPDPERQYVKGSNISCAASVPPGPQPKVACRNKTCVKIEKSK
jgi:hypothetical protein